MTLNTDRQVKMNNELHPNHDDAINPTDLHDSTHLSPPAGSASLESVSDPNSLTYHLDIVTKATKTLSHLGSSRDPKELVRFLVSVPFDGRIPEHHKSFWQADFPPVFLVVISDQAWYASFAIEHPVGGPAISVLSEQSTSALVVILLHVATRRMTADPYLW